MACCLFGTYKPLPKINVDLLLIEALGLNPSKYESNYKVFFQHNAF